MEIAILVNNVGMSYVHPDFIENVCSEKFVNDIINCNIVSVTKMTAIVLPGMVKRKGGVIANISSASGRIPTPVLKSVKCFYIELKILFKFLLKSFSQFIQQPSLMLTFFPGKSLKN